MSISAENLALGNTVGLVHGGTDVAAPWMARSDALAESPEVLCFSHILKGIAMERVRTR